MKGAGDVMEEGTGRMGGGVAWTAWNEKEQGKGGVKGVCRKVLSPS